MTTQAQRVSSEAIVAAYHSGDDEAARLARILLRMSRSQRSKLARLAARVARRASLLLSDVGPIRAASDLFTVRRGPDSMIFESTPASRENFFWRLMHETTQSRWPLSIELGPSLYDRPVGRVPPHRQPGIMDAMRVVIEGTRARDLSPPIPDPE